MEGLRSDSLPKPVAHLQCLPPNCTVKHNSGELDEEELICVLTDVGFETSEAQAIYQQVNSDGEGGVSLEEFEDWFMKNQRQTNQRLKVPIVMNYKSLEDNIEKLIVVLAREKLFEHEDHFKASLEEFRCVLITPSPA